MLRRPCDMGEYSGVHVADTGAVDCVAGREVSYLAMTGAM